METIITEIFNDLKLKAGIRRALYDTCEVLGGHLWQGELHFSKIDYMNSSSQLCVRCGMRASLDDIQNGKV